MTVMKYIMYIICGKITMRKQNMDISCQLEEMGQGDGKRGLELVNFYYWRKIRECPLRGLPGFR